MGNIIELIIVCGFICGLLVIVGGCTVLIEHYTQIREARSESHRRFLERHNAYLNNK